MSDSFSEFDPYTYKPADVQKIVAVSLYADPLTIGHISYLKAAKGLYPNVKLKVILNNDTQALAKKGFIFQPLPERIVLLQSLKFVDEVIVSIDVDESVCRTLELISPVHVFCNGGPEYGEASCREAEVCKRLGIEMRFGVGGSEKISGSRYYLNTFLRNVESNEKAKAYLAYQ
jgi:cytidyltransferase-like protein